MPGFRTGRPDLASGGVAGLLPWSGLTFTRAGAKYKENGDGTVTLAAANVPIIDSRGLLIEPAITNQTTWLITAFGWQAQGAPVITANAAIAPDGNTTATLLTTNNAGNRVFISPGGTGLYKPSLWIKRISTTGSLNVESAAGPASGNMDINLATLGAGWVRVYPGHPATSNLTAWNDGSLLIQATAGTVSVYIWGVQNEPGGVVHSLVPNTTGVVTCPKDVAYFSGLSIPSASRISGKFTARVAMADGNYHFLFDTRGRATGFGGCALFVEPTGAITARIQDTGVDVTLFSTAVLPWVALQTYAIALVQDGLGNAAITRDGVTVGSAAAQRILPVATFLTPGAASDSTLPLDGWVDRLTIQ